MKPIWIISAVLLLAGLLAALAVLDREPTPTSAPPASASAPDPIRIGLIPERDIFALRKRQQLLGDYIQSQTGRPVQLVTCNSYDTVLSDFKEKRIDAAFLGSLITVLCVDRLDAQVLLKTEMTDGSSTYHGTICVPDESPIRTVEELAGKSIAMVRTTTGGNLFPVHELLRHAMLQNGNAPSILWVGTHDDAIDLMMDGKVAAASAKSLRVKAWMAAHPGRKIRVLATSGEVPENALVVRHDLAESLGKQISQVLLNMDKTPEGKAVLQSYGAARFLPCTIGDYKVIYDLIADLRGEWTRLGVEGPAPRPLQETR